MHTIYGMHLKFQQVSWNSWAFRDPVGFFVRLFKRLSKRPEYHRPLKTVAWEDRSSMATDHRELRVVLYWFPTNLFMLNGPHIFSAFSVLSVCLHKKVHELLVTTKRSVVYRLVSAGLNGNPSTESPAVWRIGRGRFAACVYLCLLSNRFWSNALWEVQMIWPILSAVNRCSQGTGGCHRQWGCHVRRFNYSRKDKSWAQKFSNGRFTLAFRPGRNPVAGPAISVRQKVEIVTESSDIF